MRDRAQLKIRLAYLLTHPIQYQSPLLKRIAADPEIDLTVFYQSDCSRKSYFDKDFGRTIAWDTPLLSSYHYCFLPAVGGTDKLSYFRPFNYGLGPLLKTGQFNAIVIHGYNRPYHWVAIVKSKIFGLRVLIRDESTAVSKNRGPLKTLLKRIFFHLLNRFVDGYLAIGTANAKYYMDNGVSTRRIHHTPYAVDNAFFSSLADQAMGELDAFRNKLGLAAKRPIILSVGKLQPRKRPIDLLDAFVKTIDRIEPSPYLLYVGDGELKQGLQKRIDALALDSDAVRILGFKNQTELPVFYALCDVFVLASIDEPWGLVVNEAMNAGKAIIVSDHVGSGFDLVKNGKNGYIVPAKDVDALAGCLVKILSIDGESRRLGKTSKMIISKWGIEQTMVGLRKALGLSSAIAVDAYK